MNGLQRLIEEHALIREALAAITALLHQARHDRMLAVEPFLVFQDFAQRFADGAHHVKEEQVLFKEMVYAGMARDSGPLGSMLNEHEVGREYTEAMGAAARACRAGDWHRQAEMIEAARAYCALLEAHVETEEQVIYPIAAELLGPEGLRSLSPRFDEVDPTTLRQFEAAARAVVLAAGAESRSQQSKPFTALMA